MSYCNYIKKFVYVYIYEKYVGKYENYCFSVCVISVRNEVLRN